MGIRESARASALPIGATPLQDFVSRVSEISEPREANLGLAYVPQSTSLWCWAACVEMVGRRRGVAVPSPAQCAVASRVVGDGGNCCEPFFSDLFPCNQAADSGQISTAFDGVASPELLERALSEGELWRQLASGRVVQIGYRFAGGNLGHVLLVGGYAMDEGSLRFDVLDPNESEGRRFLAFDELNPYSFGLAEWVHTWLLPVT